MRDKSSKLTFGPGAASIILIVVILSMSILGLLNYMTVRNDLALSDRSADVAETVFDLNARAEKSFAALDAVSVNAFAESAGGEEYLAQVKAELPEGMTLAGDVVSWEESEGIRTLRCGAQLAAASGDGHISWKTHRLVVDTDAMME